MSQALQAYTFEVIVEPDEDRWRAYCPALEHVGGAAWGYTREEAVAHIREVLELVVEEMTEAGEVIPITLNGHQETVTEQVVITVCVSSE